MLNQKQRQKFDLMLTTIFGIGYLKPAPGTLGSLLALLILLIPNEYYIIVNILLFSITILSYFSIRNIEKTFGNDPSYIIIDEFLAMGFIISSGLIPDDILHSIVALILFRIFDIFKPFPINLINKNQGAFFVLADDFLAAIFSIILLKILIFLNNLFVFFKFL